MSVAFSWDDRRLAVGGSAQPLSLWSLPDGARLSTPTWQGRPLVAAPHAFSRDGRRLVCALTEARWPGLTTTVVDLTAVRDAVWIVNGGPWGDAAFDRTGQRLTVSHFHPWQGAAGAEVWDVAQRRLINHVRPSRHGRSAASAPTTRVVLIGRRKGAVCVLDADTGRSCWLSAPVEEAWSRVHLSPDGRFAATDANGNAMLWSLPSQQQLGCVGDGTNTVSPVWSADGSRLAYASARGVRVRACPSLVELVACGVPATCAADPSKVPGGRQLAFAWREQVRSYLEPDRERASNGVLLAVTAGDKTGGQALRWRRDGTPAASQPIALPAECSYGLNTVAAAPTGGLAAVAGGRELAESKGILVVCDLLANRVLWQKALSSDITHLVFSPDGRTLHAFGQILEEEMWTQVLRLDARSGRLRASSMLERGLGGLCLLPDGKRFATVSNDQQVRLWDAADGRLLASESGSYAYGRAVNCDPAGRFVATQGDDVLILHDARTLRPRARVWAWRAPDRPTAPLSWLVATDRHWDGSPNAAQSVLWRVGDRLRPASHYPAGRRPGLLRAVLEGRDG